MSGQRVGTPLRGEGGHAVIRLKILQVVEAAATGVGRHVLDLTEGLLRRGHSVHLVYSPTRGDAMFAERLQRLPGVGYSAVRMRSAPNPADLGAMQAIRRVMAKFGPFDVVHCHSSKAGFVARIAACGSGSRVVYSPHAIYTMSPGLTKVTRLIYRTAEIALAQLTDRIIAVSRAEFDECRAIGIPARRLALVPNTVSRHDSLPRDAARHRLGLDPEEVAVAFVGRLTLQKGIDRMLAAFVALPPATPARLVVIGDGALATAAHTQAEALGIAPRVLWLGATPAEPLLRAFDLFAMPSRYEAASYSLLEAMAAGLPVVATATGSACDLIADGENGFKVPVEDTAGFAQRLAELVTNPARLRAMADEAARPRRETSGEESMVNDILDVYGSIIAVSPSVSRAEPAMPTGRSG